MCIRGWFRRMCKLHFNVGKAHVAICTVVEWQSLYIPEENKLWEKRFAFTLNQHLVSDQKSSKP